MNASAAAPACACPDAHGRSGVRVLVLDDEEIVHWGFRLLLSRQPWAERTLAAVNEPTALALARRFEPHVALVDTGALINAPACFGRALTQASPRSRVLLLTASDALPASTVRAAGAAGFVSRSWTARQLLRVIQAAGAGLPAPPQRPAVSCQLSARQQEILQLIAAGSTNDEIALRLFLSRHTVKQHTSALYRKLGARNRTHAVQTARQRGLISV